jgi:phosphoribosylformylglycinamidine synthase
MAMGERTPLALINASASAKIAVAEVVTNILPSGISNISDVKLSANWMGSPGKLQGNKDLFEAVEAVGMDLCPKWNMTIPVGKDSLSMSTEWNENDDNKSVISPLSLIVSGFSPVKDISIAVTPELKREKESVLLYIDLAKGKKRMGGSILSQIKGQMGGDAPDVECIKEMPLFVEAIYKLLSHKKILAYHDRSDGGLITTLCEMSFASRLGLSLDLDKVVEEDHELMNFLFNEELGVVIQVCSQDLDFVFETFNKTGLEDHIYNLGTLSDQPLVDINYKGQNILSSSLKPLLEHWHRVGFEIQSLRDNPATAESEYRNDTDPTKGGLKPNINFSIPKLIDLKSSRPRIAILREQGVNGQNEMAAAFHEVGFDCFDVHMTDLISSRHQLKDFEGLVACGGFSYGDVLGAGGGWANTILFNADLRNQFGDFFHNEEVFSLGVCNGCQALSLLKPLIPGTESWPRFKRNISEKFEARLVQVSVKDSPSIFFKGMEGAVIPVPVAHGEGKVEVHKSHLDNLTSNKVTSISYADHSGNQTEEYPANPNGSIYGIAGVTNESGNVTIMMPHPERAFLNDQYSWSPEEWSHYSPWIRFFLNAREFIK